MRAAFCRAAGQIEVCEVAEPRPQPGEALLRVHACGICGSDLHFFHGGFPPPKVCPGHEISAEVVELASGTQLRPGDRVAVEPLVVCRECAHCRSGNYQLCPSFQVAGQSRAGGFADWLVMPEYALYRLPDAVDTTLGALTEPLAVGVHAVRVAALRLGETVLVLGAGTIGLLAIAAARAAGAAEVWVTARHDQQEQAALMLGATRVFRGGEADADLVAAARRHGVDVVIETVGGHADTIDAAIHRVRRGGRVVVVGVFTQKVRIDAVALMVKEVQLRGSMTYGRSGPRTDFEVALQLLAADPQRYRALLTHRVPLAEIAAGFTAAGDKSRGAIKVLVEP